MQPLPGMPTLTAAGQVILCVIVASTAPPRHLAAQDPGRRATRSPLSEAVYSDRVPAGQVRGIVFDAETGMPVKGANALLLELQRGALTDSAGLFTFGGLEPGSHTLRAQYIGYQPEDIPIQVESAEEGWVARFGLRPVGRMTHCGMVSSGIRVVVRDALTGVAPLGRVTLRVRQDTTRTYAFNDGEPGDTAVVLAGYLSGLRYGPVLRSDSPVEVEVVKSGYALWWRDDVKLEFGECSAQLTGPIHVWLLPESEWDEDYQAVTNAWD